MNLNKSKIDSLRLIIPFTDVTINPNHKEFLRTLTTINEDAEVINSITNNTYRLHSNPCSCHYLRAFIINNGVSEEVLKLGFSSKTLKSKYFEGINKENIDEIYNFIISENVIKISKETLLNAKVVDTDICKDILLKKADVKDVISYSKQLSIPKKQTNINVFNQNTNRGIEWGERNKVGKAYQSKQYLKYYAKSLELKNHSFKFYDSYIRDNQALTKYLNDDKLIRIETTIKNRFHWLTYSIKIDTLRDLLNTDLEKHPNIFKRPISNYMQGEKFLRTRTELTPNEKEKLRLIEMYNKFYDLSESEAIKLLSEEMEKTKQGKYRYVKKLEKLVNENREINVVKKDLIQLDIITEIEKINLVPKSE